MSINNNIYIRIININITQITQTEDRKKNTKIRLPARHNFLIKVTIHTNAASNTSNLISPLNLFSMCIKHSSNVFLISLSLILCGRNTSKLFLRFPNNGLEGGHHNSWWFLWQDSSSFWLDSSSLWRVWSSSYSVRLERLSSGSS